MNSSNPTISLIIPAYNEEKYIGSCLEAVLKSANGKFLEIIVINNASTDKTTEIAASFSGVRVVMEPKKGLTQARQRGFLEAKGDILAYIDADTLLPSGWVETVQSEFTNNPKLACLSGPYNYYDIPPWQQSLVKLYWYLAMPIYYWVGYMAVGGNFAIKRPVVERMNGFDTTIAFYGEDTNIARRASTFGKVKFTLKLLMPTSGRRLAGQGFLTTARIYVANFLSEAIFHRPTTSDYRDIR